MKGKLLGLGLLGIVAAARLAYAQESSDYWVVSLAWSPEFCHDEMEFHEEPQCAEAHGFVMNRMEKWSETGPVRPCGKPQTDVPDDVVAWMMDTMLNRRWIQYQWRRQGGCAGLEANEYFVEAQYLGSRVAIPAAFLKPFERLSSDPEQVRADFVQANAAAGLPAEAVSLGCTRGWLSEVRLCVDRDYRYRACALIQTGACGQELKVRGIDPRLRIAQAGE